MDPLSLNAGAIAVITHLSALLPHIHEQFNKDNEDDLLIVETELHVQLLKEISEASLWESSSIPESAKMCLQACERSLRDIELLLVRYVKPKANKWKGTVHFPRKDLETMLRSFCRSVKLLRDVVADSITHQILHRHQLPDYRRRQINGDVMLENIIDANQNIQNVEEAVNSIVRQIHDAVGQCSQFNGNLHVKTSFSDRVEQITDQSENAIAELELALRRANMASDAALRKPNPFEFIARILHPLEANPEASLTACAQLDTGSEEDWISMALLNRLGLDGQLEDVLNDTLYTGIDGNLFQPVGRVSVTWTRNFARSWQTDFLAIETSAFDMLLGRKFIVQEGLFVFADSALVADVSRLAPLSPDDYKKMEQHIRERGAENNELSLTRDAKDKARRQKRREKKVASNLSLVTTTPGSRTPSSMMYPSSSN